jgi:hypothetical protein
MDGIDPEQNPSLAAVAELLTRQRPTMTFDEVQRVDQRLHRLQARPRPPRRSSRLAVVVCLALGLLLMTAGTGLAISGFATPGSADQAQYPDHGGGSAPPSGRPSGGLGGGHSLGGNPGRGNPGRGNPGSGSGGGGNHATPSRLDQVSPQARSTTSVELALSHAETRNNLPFTGVGAVPILLAGIVLVISAGGLNRRTRGGWRQV